MLLTFPRLETDNLILRQLEAGDAPALFDYLSDDEVTRYYRLETLETVAQAEKLIAGYTASFAARSGLRWAIVKKDENRLIGTCGYNEWQEFVGLGEIGYELARPYWGHGYATEAVGPMLEYGFEAMRLLQITAWVMLDNTASIRVLHKLGFRSVEIVRNFGYWKGAFHDLQLFALDKSSFQREGFQKI